MNLPVFGLAHAKQQLSLVSCRYCSGSNAETLHVRDLKGPAKWQLGLDTLRFFSASDHKVSMS